VTTKRLPDGRVQSFVRDITERTELQARLLQAQKMESIGRLAGGIAHDFNNLLTVINGVADLAITSLHGGGPIRQDLERIREAGERAATMTRQLLAMSRQQILQPEILDLNAIVLDMQGMLQRLIGEDVALQLKLSEPLASIKADASQIEQVLLNLAVNARDAMPDGGTLTIETREVAVGLPAHRPMAPGPHVMLAVRDTGIGMDEAAAKRAFEPFFTTKEVGKGTGLGLSTVYGIVKQSGGSVWVDSRIGAGATFTIYFPAVPASAEQPTTAAAVDADGEGHETILVVEDEPAVRALTQRILQSAGYRVLTAADGAEALQRLEQLADPLDLLLTDVVMPGMNGRELATRATRLRPEIKVLYATGHTADGLLRRGVLDATSRVVTKPFTARELRRKVRETLDTL
jgi:CheY-like chemotaxis protein